MLLLLSAVSSIPDSPFDPLFLLQFHFYFCFYLVFVLLACPRSNCILDDIGMKCLLCSLQQPTISHDQSLTKVDCILFYVGLNDEIVYTKSASLQNWLLGYELTDTLCVIAENNIYMLSSKKKVEFLAQAQQNRILGVPRLHLLTRDRVCIRYPHKSIIYSYIHTYIVYLLFASIVFIYIYIYIYISRMIRIKRTLRNYRRWCVLRRAVKSWAFS